MREPRERVDKRTPGNIFRNIETHLKQGKTGKAFNSVEVLKDVLALHQNHISILEKDPIFPEFFGDLGKISLLQSALDAPESKFSDEEVAKLRGVLNYKPELLVAAQVNKSAVNVEETPTLSHTATIPRRDFLLGAGALLATVTLASKIQSAPPAKHHSHSKLVDQEIKDTPPSPVPTRPPAVAIVSEQSQPIMISTPTANLTQEPELAKHSLDETLKTKEKKEAIGPKSELIGFRVNTPEDIKRLPGSVGIIRIDGDSNLMFDDGRFHHNPDHLTEQMLNIADEKGLKVVYAYKVSWLPGFEPGEITDQTKQRSSQILGNHMRTVLKHPSVKYFEVGNELDQDDPNQEPYFWKGVTKDYGVLFKAAVNNLQEINKQRQEPAELIISSFADPMGKFNKQKTDKHFEDLVIGLKENGVNPKDYLIAGHAYHLEYLEWILNNLQTVTGTKGVIITEFNIALDNKNKSWDKELQEMLQLIEQRKIMALAHEFKDQEKDHDNRYAISASDPRFRFFMEAIHKEAFKHLAERVSGSQNQ